MVAQCAHFAAAQKSAVAHIHSKCDEKIKQYKAAKLLSLKKVKNRYQYVYTSTASWSALQGDPYEHVPPRPGAVPRVLGGGGGSGRGGVLRGDGAIGGGRLCLLSRGGQGARAGSEALRAMECLEILDFHIGCEERKTRKARKAPTQTLDEVPADTVASELEQEKEEEQVKAEEDA